MSRFRTSLTLFFLLCSLALLLRVVTDSEAPISIPVLDTVSNQEMVDLVSPQVIPNLERQDILGTSGGGKPEAITEIKVETSSGVPVSGSLLLSAEDGEIMTYPLNKNGEANIGLEFLFGFFRSIEPSNLLIAPDGGGLVRGSYLEVESEDLSKTRLVVVVPNPRTIQVFVSDHQGMPIRGVRLIPYGKLPLAGGELITSILTDMNGVARFEAFYGSQSFLVRVYARGFAMKTRLVNPSEAFVDIKLDRIFGLGIVRDRRRPFSYSIDGAKMDINFGGYRNADWKPLASAYESALELGDNEYIEWMINAERGAWQEAEENYFSPRLQDGPPYVMSVWNRAFLDPEFTVFHCPENMFSGMEEHHPQRVKIGPKSQFLAGYPKQIILAVVGAKGHFYKDPYTSPFPQETVASVTQIAYHQGDGHYLIWLPSGTYEIVQPRDADPRHSIPRFLTGQVVHLGQAGSEPEIMLARDEAYVGIQVVDAAGFPIDCRWLLFPSDETYTSLLSKPRGKVAYRFVRPGEWNLRATNGATLSMSTTTLAESLVWPAEVSPFGIWSIPIQESAASADSFTF